MELVIVILIALVAAVPVTLIGLAIRQSALQRRVQQLEVTVEVLQARLASSPPPEAAPTLLERVAAARATMAEPRPAPSVPPPFGSELPMTPVPALPPRLPEQPPVFDPVIPEPAAVPGTRVVDWEKFLGVKLFAWIGGLALFLGIGFFVKYSFEHNLVPPGMRVALGFLAGVSLLAGGVLLRRREYAVTAQSLCATGIVALYGVSFAAHGVYHLIGAAPAFLLMSLITAVAFVLADRLEARVIAVLGLAGGFLTPPLLSSGQDNPLGLFGYIALLDLGLLAVALRRRWHFLFVLSAAGTGLIELGWLFRFFAAEKSLTALAFLLLFNGIQLAGFYSSERLGQPNRESVGAAVAQGTVTFFAAFYLMGAPGMAERPAVLLGTVLLANLPFLLVPLLRGDRFRLQNAGGAATLGALALWIKTAFREQDLKWALAATLVFAVLHAVYPLVLSRRSKAEAPGGWTHAFPLAAIGLMLLTLLQLEAISLAVWPVILLLDLLAIGLALLSPSIAGALGAVLLTGLFTMAWLLRLPADAAGIGPVSIIGIFAVLFFAAGGWLARENADAAGAQSDSALRRYFPAISAILPFLLLALIIARFRQPDPSSIFGLALLLSGMLLWLGVRIRAGGLQVAALGASLFLELFWHQLRFGPSNSGISLWWYLAFYAVFMAWPFAFRRKLQDRAEPWLVSALSGPLHFYLIHRACRTLLPEFAGMGSIPALLAIPSVLALVSVLRQFEIAPGQRTRLLALFGGSALFFLTMVFPVQFSHQWLTLGWALEGAALLWLFHRVPHRGLPIVGIALLVAAFARLALNPNVFSYYPRGEVRILNWYLYSYGLVTLALLAGGRLLAPPRQTVLGYNVQPLLYSLGTILAFLLLNIEIADFFATGNYLAFEFSGNFARDMTYSIAWALFALGLLLIGIVKEIATVRYASLGLLGVTLLKLFLHDLSRLGQLYRIGAFIGVAIILMISSFLYQRFLASNPAKKTA